MGYRYHEAIDKLQIIIDNFPTSKEQEKAANE